MIVKKYLYFQSTVLLGGTIFAYYNVYLDFVRYFQHENSIFKFTDTAVTNPLTISCFYGAFCFLLAFIISLSIIKYSKVNIDKAKSTQKFLFYLLIAGTIFGFANVGYEFYKFNNAPPGGYFGCTGVLTESPLQTPCFKGSLLFGLSLLVSWFTKRQFNNNTDKNYENLSEPKNSEIDQK